MKTLPQYNEFDDGNGILRAPVIPDDIYEKVQQYTVIVCHDVFIQTTIDGEAGILLVNRLREPAKNVLWPIGGRVLRGVSTEDSLRQKVLEECGLSLSSMKYLRTARTTFHGEMYGHGHGADTINLVYWATGEGNIKLNDLHSRPTIVTKENYPAMRASLVPYVQDGLDLILEEGLWK